MTNIQFITGDTLRVNMDYKELAEELKKANGGFTELPVYYNTDEPNDMQIINTSNIIRAWN